MYFITRMQWATQCMKRAKSKSTCWLSAKTNLFFGRGGGGKDNMPLFLNNRQLLYCFLLLFENFRAQQCFSGEVVWGGGGGQRPPVAESHHDTCTQSIKTAKVMVITIGPTLWNTQGKQKLVRYGGFHNIPCSIDCNARIGKFG